MVNPHNYNTIDDLEDIDCLKTMAEIINFLSDSILPSVTKAISRPASNKAL